MYLSDRPKFQCFMPLEVIICCFSQVKYFYITDLYLVNTFILLIFSFSHLVRPNKQFVWVPCAHKTVSILCYIAEVAVPN